jgi:ElaB/YqjD/DUF883 family membrane-anchored ribosome-binding protein
MAMDNGNLRSHVETGTGATDAIDQVRQAAGQFSGQTADKAGEVLDQAKQQIAPQVESQKERIAGNLDTTASALRQTGEQLRSQDQAAVAQYLDRGADRIQQMAGYLRERQLTDLLADAEGFARRQPAMFLGAAFSLGLLAARFLKSSGGNQPRRLGAPGVAGDYGQSSYRAAVTSSDRLGARQASEMATR